MRSVSPSTAIKQRWEIQTSKTKKELIKMICSWRQTTCIHEHERGKKKAITTLRTENGNCFNSMNAGTKIDKFESNTQARAHTQWAMSIN